MADFAVSAAIRAVDKLSAVFNRMGVSVGKFGSGAGKSFDEANKKASLFKSVLGANILGNLATGAIRKIGHELGQIPEMIEQFANRGQMIGRTAGMLGLTADAFQRLAYAARLTDTPVEAMEGAFKKLNMGMGQLKVGAGPLHALMMKLNPVLAAQLSTVESSDQAFLLVADAITATENAQDRAAIAQAAFGKAGQEMIPMLAEGREGLHRLMREASIYGTVLDDKAIEASATLDDTMKRLRGSIESVKNQVLGLVVRGVTPYVEKALAWIAANKELIATRVEQFVERITQAFRVGLPILRDFFRVAGWLISNWPVLAAVYVGWTAAQIALNVALDSNPIGAVIIAIEALILVTITIIRYWREITDALRSMWDWTNKVFNNPLVKIGLMFMANGLLTILGAIQAIVDLISGRGLGQALSNLLGPWKALTDAIGLTKQTGQWNAPVEAPAPGTPGFRFINQVNVDNSRAPGTTSAVSARFAPDFEGVAGANR